MSGDYPLVLRVAGRRCVVVGGGTVATRKVVGLVEVDADVTVIAPRVSTEIQILAEGDLVLVERRPFVPSDLDGALLSFAATDQRAVNQAVAEAAHERGVPVNVADDPAACDFTVPAVVRQRGVSLAISTGGRSPAFARFLREQLENWLTDDRCALLELAGEVRRDLRTSGRTLGPSAWRRALADVRVMQALEAGDPAAARRLFVDSLTGETG